MSDGRLRSASSAEGASERRRSPVAFHAVVVERLLARAAVRPMATVVLVLVGWLLAPEAAAERITIERDDDASQTQIIVRAPDGELAWGDLVRGLTRARGFDDSALAAVLPDGTIQIDRVGGRILIAAIDRALDPSIAITLQRLDEDDEDDETLALRLTLDRVAMLATKRRLKQRLREGLQAHIGSRFGAEEQTFGIELDGNWADAEEDLPLVVLVHGLHSGPTRLAGLADACREAGMATGEFRYPNNRPIDESSELLAEELRQIREEAPRRPIALVTASMGGLVARAVVEDPQRDPGKVEQLIMIAPPNQGSKMAEFAFALDLTRPIREAVRERRTAALIEYMEEGLGEASDDLLPDSPFLRELNVQPRNPRVAYTIILGTGGPLTEDNLDLLRRELERAGETNRFVQFFGPRLDELLADLDEVVVGKGDGAVAIDRGRLEGVDDVVLLDFDHYRMLREGPFADADGVEAQLQRIVLDRLGVELDDADAPEPE